jgi:hypothetical protein
MADVEKFMNGPEREAADAAKARWDRACLAWVAAGKPECGPECGEMAEAFQAFEAASDALRVAAFGFPVTRMGRAS